MPNYWLQAEKIPIENLGRHDRDFFRMFYVSQPEAHGEPVHLCFRQGIGAMEVYGVLCGDDKKQPVQGAQCAIDTDLALGHRLQEGRLRAR